MGSYQDGETILVPDERDVQAPDGSDIRLLLSVKGGGMCHCTLLPQQVSSAGMHKSVEEIWYCLEGRGQVWRKAGDHESEVELYAGVCVTIPQHSQFQFRNTGSVPLRILIVTMPPWPGEQEWMRVVDHWPVPQERCSVL
jgi:Mannose-6-phosphate isomerase